MLLRVYNENPQQRDILLIAELLRAGAVIIFPTDTIYGMGCDLHNAHAVERLARINRVTVEQAKFSFLFNDLSTIADYCKPIPNPIFKLLKRNLPGPFTFILHGNHKIPKLFQKSRKSVGIRIPDNNIIREVIRELGHPILSTSVHDDDEVIEYTTDPELIHEKYKELVDLVVDGGYGGNVPSTIVDCLGDEPHLMRQGKGMLIE